MVTAPAVATANPILGFRLADATAKDFKALVAAFNDWARAQPLPPALGLNDGWHTVTPEQSMAFLIRTAHHGANRRPTFTAVAHYAQQMIDSDWQQTGEPMIFDKNGHEKDGQHRAWASVLTGVAFPTYVVASVPPNDNLFAYIDNSKARTAADALETAGMDGNARLLAGTVTIARRYEAGVLSPKNKGTINKASPMEVLRFVRAHEALPEAVKLMASEYAAAMELMLRDNVACFVGYKILDLHDEETLDEFMRGLVAADTEGRNEGGNVLVALRKKLEQYSDADNAAIPAGKKRKLTPWVEILAHVIKAFNAWSQHQTMKTLTVRIDEEMPKFVTASDVEEAA